MRRCSYHSHFVDVVDDPVLKKVAEREANQVHWVSEAWQRDVEAGDFAHGSRHSGAELGC